MIRNLLQDLFAFSNWTPHTVLSFCLLLIHPSVSDPSINQFLFLLVCTTQMEPKVSSMLQELTSSLNFLLLVHFNLLWTLLSIPVPSQVLGLETQRGRLLALKGWQLRSLICPSVLLSVVCHFLEPTYLPFSNPNGSYVFFKI